MDFTTVIGIIAGIILIINGISRGNLGNFVDQSSFMIVLGGTVSAVIASYPPSILMDIPRHMKVVMRGKKYDIPSLVEIMVDLSMAARRDGLLALEDKADLIREPFLKQSLLMIIDANDPEKVRYVLERDVENIMQRHDQAAGLYEKASAYAPAFGMIGTLIGLINMLKQLDMQTGSFTMGGDMAVALITTFYGSVLSNLVFHPIAKKLRVRQDEEEVYCSTVIEGVIAIQEGESPRYLREHLLTSIKQSQQVKLLAKAGRAEGKEDEESEEKRNKGLYGSGRRSGW